jgi:GTP-binding protein EngB required for normal cell division
VYLVGRSNVGKSTLLRALTGKRVPSGRRPGLTRKRSEVLKGQVKYVDLPGFGFMSGSSGKMSEEAKTLIVRGIEEERKSIDLALLVLDGKALPQIWDRWVGRREIPIDLELKEFLAEMEIPFLLVITRMDRVQEPDVTLDSVAERFGYPPPWRQWRDVLVPVSGKFGAGIPELRQAIAAKLGLS